MIQKVYFAACGFALWLALAASGAHAQVEMASPPSAPASAQKAVEQVYKNIEVLKGLPADQLLPTMQYMAAALGTQCEHCHVPGAYEKDTRSPKDFARVMMKMVFDLNKNTFGDRALITCFTCHRGNLRPMATIDPADMGRPSQVPGLVGNQPSASQMIDKYLEARGGADAIAKVLSRVARGKIETASSPAAPVEIYFKAPAKGLTVSHILGAQSSVAYNGDAGWTSNLTTGTADSTAAETQAVKLEDDLYLAANVKKLYSWHVEAPEKVVDRDAYVLTGETPVRLPVRLYLDRQTGLLLRLMHFIDTPLGRLPTQIDYADYRDVDGVKTPFRISAIRPATRYTIQLEQVQTNAPVEDSLFTKPGAPAP